MATTTITITVTGTNATPVVTYAYNGLVNQTDCSVTDTATPFAPMVKSNPDTFIFQLDQPSITSGWTMTNYTLGAGASPLTVTPGTSNASQNTSYSVYDSDSPTSGGPYSVIFEYTNNSTGAVYRQDPTVTNDL